MDLGQLRFLLGACTVINYTVLLVWVLLATLAHAPWQRLQSRWFHVTGERIDTVNYTGIAAYKLGIVLFNLAPYLALRWQLVAAAH